MERLLPGASSHARPPYNLLVNQSEPIAVTTSEHVTDVVSSVTVAGLPWLFTQSHPLSTSDFISEAKRRGLDSDLSMLRELYRRGLLIPFVYVSSRQVGPRPEAVTGEPYPRGTWLSELRHARDGGRLLDLAHIRFRPRLRFQRAGADPGH
jgi:hypothetical protein